MMTFLFHGSGREITLVGFYIIAHAWHQESLGDDFVRGASNDLWGRLMGTPYTKVPPEGTQVLERFWMANWEKGREPTFEAIR